MYSIGNTVSNIIIVLYDMVTRHHGNHFIMYKNIESLWCMPETNRTLCVNYTSEKE